MDRYGTSSPEEDPSLAVHWAFSTTLMFIQAVLMIYSQYELYRLKSEGVKVQLMGHPHVVTLELIFMFLWPLMIVLKYGGNIAIPCSLYVVWAQMCSAGLITLAVYRTLRFTLRLAQMQRARIYMQKDSVDENEKNTSIWYQIPFLRKISKALEGNRIRNVSICLFLFVMGPTMFTHPNTLPSLKDETDRCTAAASLVGIVAWLGWVFFYIWFVGGCGDFDDPYKVISKLKWQTFICFMSAIFVFIVSVGLEQKLGTSHWALAIYDLTWIMTTFLWFTESYLPVLLTKRNLALSEKAEGTDFKLTATLANPALLELFEDHLLEEWAPENLQFYKACVLFRLETRYAIRKLSDRKYNSVLSLDERAVILANVARREAFRIYMSFIHDTAHSQVNLPGKIFGTINEFFEKPAFNALRLELQSTHFETIYEPLSMVERIPGNFERTIVSSRGSPAISPARKKSNAFEFPVSPLDSIRDRKSPDTPSDSRAKLSIQDEKSAKVSPKAGYLRANSVSPSPSVSNSGTTPIEKKGKQVGTPKISLITGLPIQSETRSPSIAARTASPSIATTPGTNNTKLKDKRLSTDSPSKSQSGPKVSLITGLPLEESPSKKNPKVSLITGLPLEESPSKKKIRNQPTVIGIPQSDAKNTKLSLDIESPKGGSPKLGSKVDYFAEDSKKMTISRPTSLPPFQETSRNSISAKITSPKLNSMSVKQPTIKNDKKSLLKKRKRNIRAFCNAVARAALEDINYLEASENKMTVSISSAQGHSKASFFMSATPVGSEIQLPNEIVMEIDDLAQIFEEAKKKVFHLMATDSHRRFVRKPHVKKLLGNTV